MRAGQVVRIRVNPKDCQSVLDLMEKLGLQTFGMSYAQCVSMALASLLETARVQKILPEPNSFEFLNRMQPFMGHSHHRKKLEAAQVIGGLGEKFHAPVAASDPWMVGKAISNVPVSAPTPPPVVASEPTAEQLKDRARLTELLQAQDMRTLTIEEELEYQSLYRKIYPDG